MAHLVENMISTKGQVPWHGLGVIVDKELVTAEEIIKAIGFDFDVIKRQNIVPLNRNGQNVNVALDDSYSIIRVNKDGAESVLWGRAGRQYTPIQNRSGFSFFDNVVGKGEAIYETAGILKHGRCVFLLASMPEYIKILGHEEDAIRPYVLLANWHDGTSQLLAMFTGVRVVCNNTLNAALANCQSQVAIRHTASAEEKLKEAAKVMGLVNQYNLEMGKVFNQMALAKVTTDEILSYVRSLWLVDEKATDRQKENAKDREEDILMLAEKGHGADLDTARGTVWGAYNAVVEYVDHAMNYRSDDSRATSLFVGQARQIKQAAYEQAAMISAFKQPVNNLN